MTPPIAFETLGHPGRTDLILVHGLFDSRRSWSGVAPQLAERGFHVVCVDQRGHGQSPKPDLGYAPADFVADLEALIVDLKLVRPILVGHSMGARVGWFLAAHYPGLRGLVIGDIGVDPQPTAYLEVQRLVDSLPPAGFASGQQADEWLQAHLPASDAAYFRRCLTAEWRWQFSFPAVVETVRLGRAGDWIGMAPDIRCPVLFVRGSESTEVSAEEAARVCSHLSRCTFVEVAGAGHDVHETHAAQFAEAVATWVNREL
jgi:pimeloyl-ACP methyl ester carboxylesterase